MLCHMGMNETEPVFYSVPTTFMIDLLMNTFTFLINRSIRLPISSYGISDYLPFIFSL